MLKTTEDLFKSSAEVSLISKALAAELYKSTRNAKLKALLDKRSKGVLISRELKSELKRSLEAKKTNMGKARDARKGVGGRPRLPDPDNPENLSGAELRRYKNRQWQRSWRERHSKNEVTA